MITELRYFGGKLKYKIKDCPDWFDIAEQISVEDSKPVKPNKEEEVG